MFENLAVASINTQVNGIELSFAEKPPYDVLKSLREAGFRWHTRKQIWYARNTADNVRAVQQYVDLDASDPNFGVTPEGTVNIRSMRQSGPLEVPGEVPPSDGYSLGFGHLGNGITVWNRMKEEFGDYQTVAHISADRTIRFYDDNLPDAVKEQIEAFARTAEPTISAAQDAPVFTVPAEPVKEMVRPDKVPCLADYFDRVGNADILKDSTVEGSLWSTPGGQGYYADINAYVWCNMDAAVVFELDNAMKRGQTCKRYSLHAGGKDIRLFLANECGLRSPKDLYDFVRRGEGVPDGGTLTVSERKGVEVFSPFVAVKPLAELPENWRKSDLVKAIMAGQVYSGTLKQRLTDDYAFDAADNFGAGRPVDLPGQAEDIVSSHCDPYIRTEKVDENGVAHIRFSDAGESKEFLFDVNCDLREGAVRREQAGRELASHNAKMENSVLHVTPENVESDKVYMIKTLEMDDNTGKLYARPAVVQGFALQDKLAFSKIVSFVPTTLEPDKLYEVANFFQRRRFAEPDARIVDTGNWGQVCSGKAVEELTREGVRLNLSPSTLEKPRTFEAAKAECMAFISGKCKFLFSEAVDYTDSYRKLEAEESRVATMLGRDRGHSALDDVIGIAEFRRASEGKAQSTIEPIDRIGR